MQRTAQSLKMKNLVRGGCISGLSGMGWVLSHTTRWWGQAPHCTVWQAQASGTGPQTGRITCFLPCTVPQAFSSSLYLVCGTTELERPWSAGFCGPVQEYGKNSPGTKNPHNSHYVPLSSTLMLLSLTWMLLCIACILKTNKHETGHCCTQFSVLEGNENKTLQHITYAINSPIAREHPLVQLETRRDKHVIFSVLQALSPAKQPPGIQIQSNRLKSS